MMTIESISYIVMLFSIYSFAGWVLESIFKSCTQKRFVNSGFLYGPFCPIYGFGAMIMIFFLERFKSNILLLFIISSIVLTIWEYLVAILLEKMYKTKYWDYTQNKFNFQGRICLLNSFYWGVLGVAFTLLIHPFVNKLITRVPTNYYIYIALVLFIYLITDFIISNSKIRKINLKLNILSDITDNIKEKLEELKDIKEKANILKIKNTIEELKQKQQELKETLYKQTNRLRQAFPTMTSDKISKFLSAKIELVRKNKK